MVEDETELRTLAETRPLSRLALVHHGATPVLLIDGVSFLEIVRSIEVPFAEREIAERASEGPPIHIDELAGRYVLPRLSNIGVPCADLDERWLSKGLLLECDCGFASCWCLVARVTWLVDRVVWSELEHNWRPWRYDREFVFDRAEYERLFGARATATP